MIKELSPQFRKPIEKILDYSRYLAEGIKADSVIYLGEEQLEIPSSRKYEYETINIDRKDFKQFLEKKNLDNSILIVDEDLTSLSEFSNKLKNIPFILATSKSQSRLIDTLGKNGFYSNFYSKIDSIFYALTGKYTDITKRIRDNKIIASVSTYNDEDIIEASITHILNQGLDVFVIDNWSEDSTLKIVSRLMKSYPNRIFQTKYPKDAPSKTYE